MSHCEHLRREIDADAIHGAADEVIREVPRSATEVENHALIPAACSNVIEQNTVQFEVTEIVAESQGVLLGNRRVRSPDHLSIETFSGHAVRLPRHARQRTPSRHDREPPRARECPLQRRPVVTTRAELGSTVMVVLLAQLSDTHLLADPTAELWGHNTTLHLTSVMDSLPSKVDVIVATGDLVEDGSPDAYRRLLALTEGRAEERHFVTGNHDNPSVMRTVLGSTRPLEMVRISDRWTLALVDSQWVGHDAGSGQ